MPASLPPSPSLEQLRNQARELLRAHKAGDPAAARRVAQHLPRLAGADPTTVLRAKLRLADAQLVVAREHGFPSWPALKRHVERVQAELAAQDGLEGFKAAVRDGDAARLRELLVTRPELTAKVNEPLFSFGGRAIHAARRRRDVIEVLLEYGADVNARSDWWAGGFGVLDGATPEEAAWLVERGAVVDVHAAAALGMLDRLRELLARDPSLANAKGGDGMRPLHGARSPEVIDLLLDHGAEIDARDVDHGGTPAQHAVRDAERCRHLVRRGARVDIFMAIMLGDPRLVEACLAEDPACLDARVDEGAFVAPGSDGGHIYRYVLGRNARPLSLAADLANSDVLQALQRRCSPTQHLLLACRMADEQAIQRMLAEHPDLPRSLTPGDHRALCEAAWDGKAGAVRAMLRAGFDAETRDDEDGTPLDRAALWGWAEIVRTLLEHGASVRARNKFGATPLGTCVWGSVHFRNANGDYPACVERLIAAGADLPERAGGSPAVAAVLRRHGVPE